MVSRIRPTKNYSPYEFGVRVKPFRRGRVLVRSFIRKGKRAGLHKEALVGGSGLLGAKVGFVVGGPPGAVAGEFITTNASRKAITDFKVLKNSIKNIKSRSDLGDLSRLKKLRLIHQDSLKQLKSMAEKRSQEIAGDVGGFVGGTLVGNNIGIPFAGLATGPVGAKALQLAETKIRLLRKR